MGSGFIPTSNMKSDEHENNLSLISTQVVSIFRKYLFGFKCWPKLSKPFLKTMIDDTKMGFLL